MLVAFDLWIVSLTLPCYHMLPLTMLLLEVYVDLVEDGFDSV